MSQTALPKKKVEVLGRPNGLSRAGKASQFCSCMEPNSSFFGATVNPEPKGSAA